MEVYAIIITVIAVVCAASIVYLIIRLAKTNKSVERIAADNLKRGKEEASDFIRLTMDKVQEDKNKLNEMSDRGLMIETMLALAGHGRRLDRIEEKLQGIYNYKAYTEGLAEQIKTISGMAVGLTENISSSTATVVGFRQLVEAARVDVDKLNTSIADVENVKERIYSLITNINNSLCELITLNEKLTTIESKIQGIYEYKKYLDEIVEQVNRVKALSDALAICITDNDNKIRSFNQTVQLAYNGVDKLNSSLTDVEGLKARIASVVENMNKSVYEINYLNSKITEIVTITNEVLQTYGDAPMVKLNNIEANIEKVRELSQRTRDIFSSMVDDIQDAIEDGMSGMKENISEVKTVIDKALDDEYDYHSVYYKISDIASSVSSLESVVEEVKSACGNIESNISSSMYSLESKVDDVKSAVDSVESNISDVKYSVDNIGNGY